MSGSDGTEDQCERTRERNGTVMGDVLPKEYSVKDLSVEGEALLRDQRQEADGAPDADDDTSLLTLVTTFAPASAENAVVNDNCEGVIMQQEEAVRCNDLSSIRMDTALVTDNSCSSSVIPVNPPRHTKGPCSCDTCKVRREMFMEELEEAMRLQGLWMELRQHIRSVFNVAIETYHTSNSSRLRYDTSRLVDMHDTVVQLCKRDPHQLFMRLVGQAQEFVVEVKVRLLALLHDRSINNLAEIFLTGLLDGYDALISTASQISELVEPLEKEHLCKFNLTWECFNKKLYQNYVYTDPLVQNNLPPFIGQLRKLLPLKGPEYQGLVHRYLTFDDEMTRIGDLWPETERLIDKYNGEQAARMTRLRKFREGWELFTARRKLIQQQMWDRTMEGESELQELDGQLLTLATRGAVGALTPDSRSPSPSSDFGLDSLNVPPNTEIVQSLLDDWNKSPHQRLADIVGALTVTEGQIGTNGRGIGPPISIPVHYNEPEFRFGYECAASLVLTHTAMKSVSPVHGDRGDGEGSEGGGSEGEEQQCECHVCAVPLVSPTRIGKGPPVNFNLQTNQVDSFPLNGNGLTAGGSTNCIAANGTLDMNGVYPHLYNLYTAFRSMPNNKPSAEQSGTALVNNIDDKKLCPVGLQVKQKLVDDAESRRKQPEEIYNNGVSAEDTDLRIMDPQPCPCIYQHAKEIAERKKEVLENPPCPCLLKSKRKWDTCPCLKKTRTETVVANGHLEPQSSTISTAKTNQETKKAGTRTGSMQSIQTQTRHTTTQTPNTTHSHNHAAHQSTCPTHVHPHGSLPDLVKGTGPTHSRGHSRNNHHRTSHACHKQANIEHIKRVSCNDLSVGDGDCSDSGSSQEDSCSSSSSTPRDSSRHCDCCYCEVFGHGVPSVAPVSRNYNEMRERLRQLLTKKKAKKCKAACSPPKSPVEALPLNTNSDSKAASSHSAHRSNTPVSIGISTPRQDQRDQRDLEALLEFIEGNQNGKRDNNKKAEKKARQKQRKLEEKLKKDRQEAERQKLIELQKKTPEVTITVVDPHKPVPQRLLPQRNLPEVSILPASAPVLLTALKQSPSNKKRDKQDSINSSTKAKAVIVNSNQKAKGGTVGTIGSSHRTKAETNVDKVDGNKGNKMQASATVTNRKCHGTGDASESNCIDSSVTNSKLSKKERKKLKKETKRREEVKLKESEKPQLPDNQQPQIVTIKRVMESNCAEPTVTITLKGQTPAEDKVLFTLVNGQTKEPTPLKPEQQHNQNTSGKKKKVKGNNNQSQQGNNGGNNSNKSDSSQQQQQLCNLKQQQTNVNDGKSSKRQSSNEKLKNGKQIEERKLQQLQQSTNETKGTKCKKDKKNTENKENVLQQQNVVNRGKNQQQSVGNKKQSKVGTLPQAPVVQKSRQNSSGVSNECGSRKTKVVQQLDKNNRVTGNKSNKTSNNGTGNANKTKCDGQKDQSKTANQNVPKQRPATEIQNTANERLSSPLSSQFKDIGTNSKINIENLKLPPGITITKVDAPAKPLPIRSAPIPKPVNPPKQTTIIAAPMSGVQSSYASSQSGGNVIVVDTGKLKQDLLPKSSDKDLPKDGQQGQSISGKKKKKKGKSSPNVGNMVNVSMMQSTLTSNNCLTTNEHADEPARILHNPGTNMVTIRNPAFGPPKMEPTQQAAIIKVSENGMVTIRSPALQQAINAGLTPPPKPNFIVKGDLSSNSRTTFSQNSRVKQTNSIIPTSLAELRSRLTPDCTGLTGLANIQISKVTNGQPIPENGINLKGTSVTLTKVRSEAVMDDVQQAKTAVREAISATMAASGSGKGKKKKKRGNGTRQSGDDWNLVESVFTPKDIDLEDGEMDDAERELEAFKRFCLQSVPPARKEKVNLNIKDIVLKKKSSGAATAAVIAAI